MRLDIAGRLVSLAVHGPPPSPDVPAVLFLHGAGMDGSVWALQAPRLGAKGATALVPDLPGHGRSGGDLLTSIDSLAALVWQLADALGLRRIALVGHSMGALTALAAAGARPERATHLALLGAALALPVNAALLAAARDEPAKAAGLIAGWGLGCRASLTGGGVPGGSLDGAVRALLAGARPGALHADLAACDAYKDGTAAAARVTCPTLVLIGAEDRMAPPKRGRELAAAIAGAAAVVVPGAGHMLMLEAPEPVARALIGGLTRPRPSPAPAP
jgi:pimeloyl-ACP methyl ester carboxylesterase